MPGVVEREELPAAHVLVDGQPVACSTWLAYAGAYQLTLSSTLAACGVELHSSYLGHPDGQVTIATHLLLAPYRTPRTWDVQHRAGELPVRHARRRCALDHFSVLRDELAALTHCPVRLDLDDAALERVDTA